MAGGSDGFWLLSGGGERKQEPVGGSEEAQGRERENVLLWKGAEVRGGSRKEM